ncbi:hypothetical protein VNI00_011769 [Paramarasmius palmivorus]|uniref:Uncharacterized protein n=1 Tax=Paramarasmius palmivorus TaxID=297713 RepID=A0AAW0C9S9_9AGAR
MSTRLFAVIIGIDHYKSGDTWDLQSCVDDAKRLRRWLRDDLAVPREHISMLTDEQASKQNIETELKNHLLLNDAVHRGDAILIYFACHGSSMKVPSEWLVSKLGKTSVEVLCPYDHDTKQAEGRVAGISARAMNSFLQQLASVKGDNITLMIDSCFSPPTGHARERQYTRWTSTNKARPVDLTSGLFASGQGPPNFTFSNTRCTTHTTIMASKLGDSAVEGKDGGRFTSAFLKSVRNTHLHSTPLPALLEHITQELDGQQPQCTGKGASQMLFGGIPFVPDTRFVLVQYQNEKGIKIELGSMHGVVKGGEFSLHLHNYQGSCNPAIATVVVNDVYPTWCMGRSKIHYPVATLPRKCWALMNERPVVGALLRKSCSALLQRIGIPQSRSDSHPQDRKSVSRAVSYEDMEIVKRSLPVPEEIQKVAKDVRRKKSISFAPLSKPTETFLVQAMA